MIRKPILDVLNGQKPSRRPIWFMRQAGRYLPEYRRVRERAGSFLDLCYNPELACEVTLQPLRRYDLDAAIVFADILVVPHAMGLELSFVEGEGPILSKVSTAAAVAGLTRISRSWQVEAVCQTLRNVRQQLPAGCALIGFCGAPWTVASYMIEGRSSDRSAALRTARDNPAWFGQLINLLVDESVDYLSAQIEAGAEAVQIFDSWAGDLPSSMRFRWVDVPLAEMTRRLRLLHPKIPVIVFARGVGIAQPEIALATKCQAVGIESELSILWADQELSELCAVQGNLDPLALLGPEEDLCEQTLLIAGSIGADRNIFNLGHGIRPHTDPDRLQVVIDTVRNYDGMQGYG